MKKKMLGLGIVAMMTLLLLPVSLAQVYYSNGQYYTYTDNNRATSGSYPYSMSQYYNDDRAQPSGQRYLSYDARSGEYWNYNDAYGTNGRYGTYGTNGIGSVNNPYQTTQYTSEQMPTTKSNSYSDTYRQLNMVNNQHTINQVTPVNRIHQATTYRTTQSSSTQMMPGRTETVQTNS